MRWALTELEPPADEPVSVAEAKVHIRFEEDSEDALIGRLIKAAREYAERHQNRTFITRRWRLSLERFPSGRTIYLPRPPLQSVEAITYMLADGTMETLDPTLYVVDTESEPGAVHLLPGVSWPGAPLGPGMPVRVDFKAGYGDPASGPGSVVQAMLLLVAHWFENREAVTVGVTSQPVAFAVEALLNPDRVWYSGPE